MRRLIAISLLAAGLLTGCGGGTSSGQRALPNATLVLDFTPNAVHVGIYEALARHDDVKAGVRLHILVPGASTDSIRLLETGRVNFAILDIHDLAIARERGQDIVGVMALEQRPLAAVIAAPGIRSPRALAGRTVGITGVPSDTAVLDSIVTGSGGRPADVRTVTIGFNAVADLLAGRVAAATAFWDDEGVALRRLRPGFHVFRVDQYGAPSYPELIVCATAASLHEHPALASAVIHALAAGYAQVLSDPASGERALLSLVPGLEPSLVGAELRALLPAFRGPHGRVGVLPLVRLHAWARWETHFGIVRRLPDVGTMFASRFLPATG